MEAAPSTETAMRFLLLILVLCCPVVQAANAPFAPYVGSAEALGHFADITAEHMAALRSKRILFASRSFGLNTRDGLAALKAKNPMYDLLSSYVRYDVFSAGGDLSIIPADIYGSRNFVHFLATYSPLTRRVAEVETLMGSAPWNFGNTVDVVIIFYHTSTPATFDYYASHMDAMRARHPNTAFIYVCAGYMDGTVYPNQNLASYQFNELVKTRYRGVVPIYDMAAILSKDGESGLSYHPDYSNDPAGVHPNSAAGEEALAKGFLVVLKETFFGRGGAPAGPAPSVPSGLSATAASSTSIQLAWQAATIASGTVAGYRVARDGTVVAAPMTPAFLDTGLAPGSTHSYTVAAVSDQGVVSAASAAVSATTAGDATAPTLVAARATDASTIVLDFSEPLAAAPAQNAANYTVTGGSVLSAALSGASVTLHTTALAAGAHTVAVSNLVDLATPGNVIAAGTQAVVSVAGGGAAVAPIAAWSFDGDLVDQAGGSSGTWKGNAAFATGQAGQALVLSGGAGGNHVVIPDQPQLDGMARFTLSVWARKNAAAVGGSVVKKHVAYDLNLNAGGVGGYLFNSTGARVNIGISNAGTADTAWHHYCLTYDGSTLTTYVDGVAKAQSPFSGIIAANSNALYVGKNPWGDAFAGGIDALRLYDHALDAGQVAALHAGDPIDPGAADRAAVQALLSANGVGRSVDGVAVFNATGRVTELYLQEAGISRITADIGTLTELTVLHCYGDRALGYPLLTSVDPAIAACTRLRTLLLTQNELTDLPPAITGLGGLAVLSVGENRLADIGQPVRAWLDANDPDWLPTQLNYVPPATGVGGGILWLPCDGDLADAVGTHAGAWTGTAAFAAGRVGQALALTGGAAGNYATVADRDDLDGMARLSLSLWVRKADAAVGGNVLKKHVAYDLNVGADSVSGYLFNAAGTRVNFSVAGAGIADTAWHHLCLVYDGATLTVYVDGTPRLQKACSGTVAPTKNALYIGKNPWGAAFGGGIDEVRLFDRTLTTDEVQGLAGAPPAYAG